MAIYWTIEADNNDEECRCANNMQDAVRDARRYVDGVGTIKYYKTDPSAFGAKPCRVDKRDIFTARTDLDAT